MTVPVLLAEPEHMHFAMGDTSGMNEARELLASAFFVERGSTWVDTNGGGNGFNPLNLNSVMAPLAWGGTNPAKNNSATDSSCGK